MVQIKNLQKTKRIISKTYKQFTQDVLNYLGQNKSIVAIVFCDNRFITKINRRYLNHRGPTDVIAFNMVDDFNSYFLGEVFVSVDEAVKQCAKYGNKWQKELKTYIVHGILHLLGYNDHTKAKRAEMNNLQEEILEVIAGM